MADTPDESASEGAELLEAEVVQPTSKESVEPATFSPKVEKLFKAVGVDGVSSEHRIAFAKILDSFDFESVNPEEDPRILEIAKKQLEKWGYKKTDIHEKSLKVRTVRERLTADINAMVAGIPMPTENYTSNVHIYNYETTFIGDTLSYVKNENNERADRFESLLRVGGDRKCPTVVGFFLGKKRTKATPAQIAKNIRELGLQDFEIIEEGGEVKSINENIEDIKKGAFLDDLLRLRHESLFLEGLDPQEALKLTGQLLDDLHQRGDRGIGEMLANDVVLQVEDGQIKGVRLAIPDVAYSENVEASEQKAMDLLDLCFAVGTAGFQNGDAETAKVTATTNIQTILSNYTDEEVKADMKKLVDTGKPYLTVHNELRLGYDRIEDKKAVDKQIRQIIKEAA